MGFWDDVELQPEAELDENPYLVDNDKGFELIASLLPAAHRWTTEEKLVHQLDYLIDYELVGIINCLHSIDSIAMERQLKKISDQLVEYKKADLLMDKSIVGIGGMFSAGKSAFINSLLIEGEDLVLPENQIPTTSIATYVISGKEQIQACKKDGSLRKINYAAMQAMTHSFYKTHGIGFSRFVENLIVVSSRFPTKLSTRIIFLDTPGYSKADANTRDSLSDENIARNHLKVSDFVIWLIAAENGTVQIEDIRFLKSLELNVPILVVVNKADKHTKEDCKRIVSLIQKTLADHDIDVFGVAAYSAQRSTEFLNKNYVNDFLQLAAKTADEKQDVDDVLMDVLDKIHFSFNEEIKEADEDQRSLGDSIYKAEDVLALQSLVTQYRSASIRVKGLRRNRGRFIGLRKKIKSGLEVLFGKDRMKNHAG